MKTEEIMAMMQRAWDTESEQIFYAYRMGIQSLLEELVAERDDLRARLEQAEPFGIWHQADDPDECEFFLFKESGDVSCPNCIKVYTHPAAPVQPYDQQALELCEVCGWKTLIPGDGCLNCERKVVQPVREPLTCNTCKHFTVQNEFSAGCFECSQYYANKYNPRSITKD